MTRAGRAQPFRSIVSKPTPVWLRDHPGSPGRVTHPRVPRAAFPGWSSPQHPRARPLPTRAPRLCPPARGLCYGRGGSRTGRDPLASAGREISGGSPTSKGSSWRVSISETGTRCWAGALLRGLSTGTREGTPTRAPRGGEGQEGAHGERGDIRVYFLQKNKLPPSSTPPPSSPQPNQPQGRRHAPHGGGRNGGPCRPRPFHGHGKGSVHGRSVSSPRSPAGCPLPRRWSRGGLRAAGAGGNAGPPPAPGGPRGASMAGRSRRPAAGCG